MALLSALLLVSGCSDDENPVEPGDEPKSGSLVGSWGGGYQPSSSNFDYGSLVCYPNGTMILWVDDDPDNDCDSLGGAEVGQYTFDRSSGQLSFVCLIDNNGCGAFAENGASFAHEYEYEVRNDSLIVFDKSENRITELFARTQSSTNPIVGSWGIGHYASSFPEYMSMTFYGNGLYIIWASNDPVDPNSSSGVEIGTYAYNASGNTLQINTVIRDDNGSEGFADDGSEEFPGAFNLTCTIVNDEITLTRGSSTWSGPRVME